MGGRRGAVVAFVMIAALAGAAHAEVLDRVIAVVDGRMITLSDVRTIRTLELLDPSTPAAPLEAGADPVVEHVIDRVLVLQEVERYAPAPPDDKTIDAALARVAQRIGSTGALTDRLHSLSVSSAWLRQWIIDGLRIQAYVDQRFGNAVQPSDEEIEAYFREHQGEFPNQDASDARVQAAARAQIVAIRRRALLAEWVTGLRRRAEIRRPAGH